MNLKHALGLALSTVSDGARRAQPVLERGEQALDTAERALRAASAFTHGTTAHDVVTTAQEVTSRGRRFLRHGGAAIAAVAGVDALRVSVTKTR